MPPRFALAFACLPLLACVQPKPDPNELFLDRHSILLTQCEGG